MKTVEEIKAEIHNQKMMRVELVRDLTLEQKAQAADRAEDYPADRSQKIGELQDRIQQSHETTKTLQWCIR